MKTEERERGMVMREERHETEKREERRQGEAREKKERVRESERERHRIIFTRGS